MKVSIELPVATRHRRDMTEKLLKATLNPHTHTHTSLSTVMILSFQTDMPGQTVQTQIRLLLVEEQSDLGLHCLPFCLHRLDSLLYG